MGTDYRYLDDGNDDGTIFGQDSSEKIGFWGTTPCDQPASANQAAVTATLLTTVAATAITTVAATAITTVAATAVTAVATTAATTGGAIHGYASNTQADDIVARVNQLITDVGAYDGKINQLITDVMAYDGKINQLIADSMVYDGKINQAVADVSSITTLVNQIRTDLVECGLIKGSA